jgi:hypothetical protein
MTHPTSSPPVWLSTHEAALVMDCHPQTVRDRCDRNELSYTRDSITGHRRIAATELQARGYDLQRLDRLPANGRTGFSASVTAQVEGVLTDAAAQELATQVLQALTKRDAVLVATAARLGETRAALSELATTRFWQRPRVRRRLRAAGVLPVAPVADSKLTP